MEKKFTFENHHCGSNKKVMDIINKKKKSPETVRLIGKRQNITKTETFGSFSTATWTERYGFPDDRKEEVAAIDLELLFRNNKKNRWGGS